MSLTGKILGRPKLYGARVIKMTFSLDPKLRAWIEKKENMSRLVNKLLIERMEFEQKEVPA